MKNLFKAIGIFCLTGIGYTIIQLILTLTCREWTSSIPGLYVTQSLSLIICFGLSAYWGIHATEHTEPLHAVGIMNPLSTRNALLAAALIVVALPFVSFTEQLNKLVPLPDALMLIEQMAAALMERIMNTSSYGRLLLNILVVACVPAICEEIMFRGWIQRRLTEHMNHHIAIWVAAIIFSTIHIQFLGFVPRLFLGLTLGYAYYYTGSLWASILMHFFNNALATVMAFLTYNKIIADENVTAPIAIASLALSVTILFFLSKNTRTL